MVNPPWSGRLIRSQVRRTLRVPKEELSDKDLIKLVSLLDDEGTGNLEIDEITDFVERGSEAFKVAS